MCLFVQKILKQMFVFGLVRLMIWIKGLDYFFAPANLTMTGQH